MLKNSFFGKISGMIRIIIELEPVSWKAPRIYRNGAYSPHTLAKQTVEWHVRQQYRGEPLTGPLRADFKFFMPIPQSTSKKNRELMISGNLFHVKKLDRSNMLKFYEDCLQGIVYKNDSQICCGWAEKVYDERPRTEITIEEL